MNDESHDMDFEVLNPEQLKQQVVLTQWYQSEEEEERLLTEADNSNFRRLPKTKDIIEHDQSDATVKICEWN